jgi:putative sigma-54 modulation protein
MNVIVQSKTLKITEAIRAFVEHEAEKLRRRGQKISQVTVFLEQVARKKNDVGAATAKFLVELPGRQVLVQHKAHDLYLAISEAAGRATLQVRRFRERRVSHQGLDHSLRWA